MHAFNAVLEAADPRIEKGEISSIDPQFSKNVLSEYLVLQQEDEA